MKKRLGILFVVMLCMLGGCSKTTGDVIEPKTEETGEAVQDETGFDESLNHVSMVYSREGDKRFKIFPSYYQQDYDTALGNSTIAESGNLLTCLAMIYSYEKDEYITPDAMMSQFPECFDDNGMDKDAIMEAIGNDLGMKFYHDTVDIEKAVTLLNNAGYYLLIRIAHPSMYGELSTYVIIEKATEEGNVVVRDANRYNIENYASFNEYGEPVYRSLELFGAAGQTAEMYVLMYYDGTDFDYSNLLELYETYENGYDDSIYEE